MNNIFIVEILDVSVSWLVGRVLAKDIVVNDYGFREFISVFINVWTANLGITYVSKNGSVGDLPYSYLPFDDAVCPAPVVHIGVLL